jgi:hypothetical protein
MVHEREYVHKRIVEERAAMDRLLMLNASQTADQGEKPIAAINDAN